MPEQLGPSARQVHAILASAVSDPELLERWRLDPNVSPAEFDFDSIWRFSGLVTKVRHNDLRASLPAMFRMLDSAGISIELFAAYAPTAARLRTEKRSSKAEKIAALVEFIGKWLDLTQRRDAMIWDVARHEAALFHFRELATAEIPTTAAPEYRPDSVPVRRTGTVQYEMSSNPVSTARAVLTGGDLTEVPAEPSMYAYCLAKDNPGTTVIAIDELASFLLDAAEGELSIADMAEQLRLAGVPIEAGDLLEPISVLAGSGLLELKEKSCA